MFKKGWETPWEFLRKPARADGPLPALGVNPRATGSRTGFLAQPPPAAALHKNHLESGHEDRPVQKPCRGTAGEAGVWRLGRELMKSQAAPLPTKHHETGEHAETFRHQALSQPQAKARRDVASLSLLRRAQTDSTDAQQWQLVL